MQVILFIISLFITPPQGSINGTITDDLGDPVSFANVALYQDKNLIRGVQSDLDGLYIIGHLDSGEYSVEVSFLGMQTKRQEGIALKHSESIVVNFSMSGSNILNEVQVVDFKVPLISHDNTTSGGIVTAEQIRNIPIRNINAIAAATAGVSRHGEIINIKGSRSDATVYFLNGVRVSGALPPESEIESNKIILSKSNTGGAISINSIDEKRNIVQEQLETEVFGILTAGEIHDFSKWTIWKDISENELKTYKTKWKIYPEQRYTLELIHDNGLPVIDAKVKLINKANNEVEWEAKTDNLGNAELWAGLFDENDRIKYFIKIITANKNYTLNNITQSEQIFNSLIIENPCDSKENVDIAFVVDATRSMSDEINFLKSELSDVIHRIKDSLANIELNLASVFYRDHREKFLTKTL